MNEWEPTIPLPPQDGAPADAHHLPHEIGPYRVTGLREGGMGIVYIAEQSEPIARRVAIKVMKWGLDSPAMVARFESERRLLALLGHPNIAQIYEAGATSEGSPYFVMEYVDGVPISEFASGLPLDEKLRLFQQVCRAVQHAHQKGVIHRDLKPTNILVTESDGRPLPKIIDFGIAKMADESLAAGGARTRAGEMLGTPEYASPEQIATTSPDTRTDVYSLGVVLYELVTGELPFDLDRGTMSWADILRVVREDDPVPPSARSRELPRELDWIVMRALEKDPARRYQSPASLADDLQRFLDDKPVEAGPPSRVYRFRKFVRRHAAASIAIAAIILTLAISGTLFGIRLKQERDEAMRQAARAEAMNRFLFGLFDAADPYAANFGEVESEAAGKLIRRGVTRLDVELASQPELRTEMLARLGEVELNLNLTEDGEKTLRRAVVDRTKYSGPNALDTLRAKSLLGRALFMRSQYEEADRVLAPALAALRKTNEREDVANAAQSLGRTRRALGQFDSAEALYDEALAIRKELKGENDIDYATSLGDLAALKREMGKRDESIALQRKVVAIFRRALGDRHPEVGIVMNNLAVSLMTPEHAAEAEQLLRDSLKIKQQFFAADHVEMAGHYSNLGRAMALQGKFEEGRALAERGVAIAKKGYGERHARTARTLVILGRVCLAQGDVSCAQNALRPAVEIFTEAGGADSPRAKEAAELLAEAIQSATRQP